MFENEKSSDRNDLKTGEVAAVPFGFVKTFTALEFKSDHLLVTKLVKDLGSDRGTGDKGAAHIQRFAASGSENFVESHGITDGYVELLNIDFVTCGDTILLSTGLDNCVCHRSLPALRAGKVPPVTRIGKRFFKNAAQTSPG